MTGTTRAILRQVIDLGYTVTVRHAESAFEIEAAKDGQRLLVRCDSGEAGELRAACDLAERVGIDLEG